MSSEKIWMAPVYLKGVEVAGLLDYTPTPVFRTAKGKRRP